MLGKYNDVIQQMNFEMFTKITDAIAGTSSSTTPSTTSTASIPTKNKNELITKIDGKLPQFYDMELAMFTQSYEQLYKELKSRFPSMYNPADFTKTIEYNDVKQMFSISQEAKFQSFTLEGAMGKLFYKLLMKNTYFIEVAPYVVLFVIVILGNKQNRVNFAISEFTKVYDPKEYNISINNNHQQTGDVTFYFNSNTCTNFRDIKFSDLVNPKKNNEKLISKTDCVKMNISELLDRLDFDANELGTKFNVDIAGKLNYISDNLAYIQDAIVEFIYIMILYKNALETPIGNCFLNSKLIRNIARRNDFIEEYRKYSTAIKNNPTYEYIIAYLTGFSLMECAVPGLNLYNLLKLNITKLNNLKNELNNMPDLITQEVYNKYSSDIDNMQMQFNIPQMK